jgi:hypothetical protein
MHSVLILGSGPEPGSAALFCILHYSVRQLHRFKEET